MAQRFPDATLLVCGHTHHAASYSAATAFCLQPVDSTLSLEDSDPWLINPGAVSQSRDGSRLARYAVLELDAGRVIFRGVWYDYRATLAKMEAVGLVATVDLPKPVGVRRYAESVRRRWARFRAGR